MQFRVRFYETATGRQPVHEFLEELRNRQPMLHKLVTAGLLKLRDRSYHGPPLTKQVAPEVGILEMRVGDRDIARIFFFFRPNQEIVCTNGYVKKSAKLDPSELERAVRYKHDWEQRYDSAKS